MIDNKLFNINIKKFDPKVVEPKYNIVNYEKRTDSGFNTYDKKYNIVNYEKRTDSGFNTC
jgi:hypothetical protein